MSAEAVGWVWQNSPYTGAGLLVHLAIADVVNDAHGNEFWMATDKLAKKARVSRSTVVATLSDMVGRELLAVLEPGGESRRPTRYQFTSAVTGLASAVADLASPNWPSPLARPPRANSIETNLEKTADASALTDLADPDCFQCHGTGTCYYPSAGRDGQCPCTKPLAASETA